MIGRANIAGVRVIVDGHDLTPMLEERAGGSDRRRLVSLTLTEKRGDEADQLDIVIDDTDGRLALPQNKARIEVAIGWQQGTDVDVGLVAKGSFVVEDVEHAGPPDLLTIRARAADFTSEIRERREHSWIRTTLGQVVADLAKRNGLDPRCAPSLASIAIATIAQSRESDIAFLRRLGRAHDALATVKDAKLIFSPIGSQTTTTGLPLPTAMIRRRDGDRHAFKIEKPQEATKVEAQWHDRKSATRQTETHGDGKARRRLSRVYPTKEAASTAARSEHRRASRAQRSLDLSLACGRAALFPGQRLTTRGFKPEIDGSSWLIDEVVHVISDRGFLTHLKLETV